MDKKRTQCTPECLPKHPLDIIIKSGNVPCGNFVSPRIRHTIVSPFFEAKPEKKNKWTAKIPRRPKMAVYKSRVLLTIMEQIQKRKKAPSPKKKLKIFSNRYIALVARYTEVCLQKIWVILPYITKSAIYSRPEWYSLKRDASIAFPPRPPPQ